YCPGDGSETLFMQLILVFGEGQRYLVRLGLRSVRNQDPVFHVSMRAGVRPNRLGDDHDVADNHRLGQGSVYGPYKRQAGTQQKLPRPAQLQASRERKQTARLLLSPSLPA